MAREERGHGVGDALLGALEQRARLLGYHKMVLAAFPTNAPGMRLYERHQFQTVGIYHEQGLLDGGWVDVIVMEKLLVTQVLEGVRHVDPCRSPDPPAVPL